MKMYVVDEDPGRRGNFQNYSHYLFMMDMQTGKRREGPLQLWSVSHGAEKGRGKELHSYDDRKQGGLDSEKRLKRLKKVKKGKIRMRIQMKLFLELFFYCLDHPSFTFTNKRYFSPLS